MKELHQLTEALSTLPTQPSDKVSEEQYLNQLTLPVIVEQLRSQNEELAATHQELKMECQHYQELFELLPGGYLVTDRQAVILEANQAAAKLLNCSEKHFLGKPLTDFVPVKAHQGFKEQLKQLQSAREVKELQVEIQPRRRARQNVTFKVAAVRDSHEKADVFGWLIQENAQDKQCQVSKNSSDSNLEQVKERTVQLYKINEQLKQEIAERHRAESALRQQMERERLMKAIAQRLSQSLKLEEILGYTVAEVRQFLQVARVIIYRFDTNEVASVVAESVDAPWVSLLGTTVATPLLKEWLAYQQGNALVINHIQQIGLPLSIKKYLQAKQIKANLSVPIFHGQQFWGLIAIHNCSGARQWQQLEIDLLLQIATQLSIAIQQSELYEQLMQLNVNLECQVQERTTRLEQAVEFEAMLKRITDKVRDSLDEGQILQTAVRELAIGLGIEGCNASWYNMTQGTSTICYEYVTSIPGSHGRVAQMANFPEIYNQLLIGHYFQFCSITPSPVRGHVVMLACPIMNDQGVLGDLWLINHKEYTFNDLEIRLVQQVANQCAIAIRQARLYQAATAQVKELENLNQLKDDFLSTVSHELRTPIANMKMAIQMLGINLNREQDLFAELEKPVGEQNRLARYFQILHNECERELSLINNLLDLQRLYAGVQPLVMTSIHLPEWLPKVVEPFQERARSSQQSLQIEISPSVPAFISDPASLGRILGELLNNACKYTPPEKEIVVKASVQSEKMYLSVCNSGVEIPQQELDRIFDKFYRIPSNDPWKQGGTGLGLTLVKQLVTHLGGTIQVESAANKTCFTLQLPLVSELVSSK